MVKPIPDGYNSVTVYLAPNGAQKLLDFMKEAFGAEETVRMDGPDGKIAHCEVRIGDSVVMLGDNSGEDQPATASLHLYVEACDDAYNKAIAAGAKSLTPPADQFYGDRGARIVDPVGNHWWIATHVEDLTEEEIAKRAQAAGA